jgi:hypothetical protein
LRYYNPGFLPSWNQGAINNGIKQMLPGFATPGFGSDEKYNEERENRAENRRENRGKHTRKNQKSDEEEKTNTNINAKKMNENMLGNQDTDKFDSNNLGEGNAIEIGGNFNRALGDLQFPRTLKHMEKGF